MLLYLLAYGGHCNKTSADFGAQDKLTALAPGVYIAMRGLLKHCNAAETQIPDIVSVSYTHL